jgi:hypothetical protein
MDRICKNIDRKFVEYIILCTFATNISVEINELRFDWCSQLKIKFANEFLEVTINIK